MNATIAFSFPQGWNAQDLADAVPLRLFEFFDFELDGDANTACSANTDAYRSHERSRDGSYLPASAATTLFRIRG